VSSSRTAASTNKSIIINLFLWWNSSLFLHSSHSPANLLSLLITQTHTQNSRWVSSTKIPLLTLNTQIRSQSFYCEINLTWLRSHRTFPKYVWGTHWEHAHHNAIRLKARYKIWCKIKFVIPTPHTCRRQCKANDMQARVVISHYRAWQRGTCFCGREAFQYFPLQDIYILLLGWVTFLYRLLYELFQAFV